MDPSPQCGISQRCFSMDAQESTLHFQIVDLGRQYYVWISAGGAKMSNLYLAIQTPAVRMAGGSCMEAHACVHSSCCCVMAHSVLDPACSAVTYDMQDTKPSVATVLQGPPACASESLAQRLGGPPWLGKPSMTRAIRPWRAALASPQCVCTIRRLSQQL